MQGAVHRDLAHIRRSVRVTVETWIGSDLNGVNRSIRIAVLANIRDTVGVCVMAGQFTCVCGAVGIAVVIVIDRKRDHEAATRRPVAGRQRLGAQAGLVAITRV